MTDLPSKAVREALHRSGLSLYAIEKQTGVSAGMLSRFLRGERTLTVATLDKLAEVLVFRVRPRKRAQRSR